MTSPEQLGPGPDVPGPTAGQSPADAGSTRPASVGREAGSAPFGSPAPRLAERTPVGSTATDFFRLRRAVVDLDPPMAVLDLEAFDRNASDLLRRAGGKPIRVASKSVRVPGLLRRVLDRPGFAGLLCYSLAEALWLQSNGFDDLVLGYPTVDRAAISALSGAESAASAITLMIDDVAQLDLIDAVVPPGRRPTIRVAIELDAAYRPAHGVAHLGARRSPLHTPKSMAGFARLIAGRPGFRLVGIMAYEGQIAGVGNAGRGLRSRAVRVMQKSSAAELAQRRAAGGGRRACRGATWSS